MVAVGFVLIWGGYSVGLWGWCLLRDYNVTFGQLVSPSHPYSGAWPPAKIPAGQLWPGAQPAASTTAATSSTPTPAQVGTSVSNETSLLQRLSDLLPGFGAIK